MWKTVGICCAGDWSLFGKKLIDCKKKKYRSKKKKSISIPELKVMPVKEIN